MYTRWRIWKKFLKLNVKMKEEFLNYLKNTNFEDLTDEELEDNIIDKVTEIMEQN